MPRADPRIPWRGVVFIAIAFALIGLAILFRVREGVAAALGLSLIGLVGISFIALPFTGARRASSRWFRHATLICGIAALLSTGGHALLLFQPHHFDRVYHFMVQISSMILSGVWLGALLCLFASEELWDARKRDVGSSDEKT